MFDQDYSRDPEKKETQIDQEQTSAESGGADQPQSAGADQEQNGRTQSVDTDQGQYTQNIGAQNRYTQDGQAQAAGHSAQQQEGARAQAGRYSGQSGYGSYSGQSGSSWQSGSGWQNESTGRSSSGWQNESARQNSSGWQNESTRQNSSGWQNESTRQNSSGWQNESAGRSGSGWQNESARQSGNAGQNAGGWQNPYNSRNQNQSWQGSYQYGNGSGNYGTGYSGTAAGKKKEKKHREKKPVNPFWKKALAVVVGAVCFGVIAGVSFLAVASLGGYRSGAASASAVAESEPAAAESAQGQTAEAQSGGGEASVSQGTTTMVVTDVTEVVEQVMPAIVAITNESVTSIESFWGQTYEQQQESAGSGIIIGENDEELLIATNNHVVADATQLYVSFIDNAIVEAKVKGTSPSMDLAVIAVKKENVEADTREAITIAQMGDSDSLKVGEPVIAIGNALGYGQSVTTGVVSALNRVLEVDETGTSNAMIQTDAAINPGNSGGALLDINGQVIGINSNKIGGNAIEGMGYAIPISAAQPIIEQLMNQETREALSEAEKGYLGISCINVTAAMAEAYGMPEGIYVAQVYEGTGAAEAGIVKGDIITGVNGMTVTTQDDLLNAMQYYAIGETIEITVMHGNPTEGYAEESRTVTLTSQEAMNAAQQ